MRHFFRSGYFVIVACVFGAVVRGGHAAERLKITPECGSIKFVGSKDDGSHEGGFKEFSGVVEFVTTDLTSCRIKIDIETGSLWADNSKLADHLRNADFFHVSKFPKAVFRTEKVREANQDEKKKAKREEITHMLSGELTLLGVSQKLDIPLQIELNDKRLLIQGTYRLDRTQFGMDYGLGKIHNEVPVRFMLKIPRESKS
jgi:polyisoprenoid-binding protein YceI